MTHRKKNSTSLWSWKLIQSRMTHEIPVPMQVSLLRGHIPSPYPDAPRGGMLFPPVSFHWLYLLDKWSPKCWGRIWLLGRQGRLAYVGWERALGVGFGENSQSKVVLTLTRLSSHNQSWIQGTGSCSFAPSILIKVGVIKTNSKTKQN